MLVSVIIPAYDRQQVIGRAIESAIGQLDEDMEIIVADDGSTDRTAAAAKAYGDAVKVISQTRHGPASARNMAINNSSGQWLAFLDSDDAWLEGKLAAQLQLLQENPGARMCICSHRTITPDGQTIDRPGEMPKNPLDFQKQLLENSAIATDSVVVSRDLYDEIGGFDESLTSAEDVKFYLQCAAKARIVFDPTIYSEVYISEDGTVNTLGRISRIESRIKVFTECQDILLSEELAMLRRQAIGHEYVTLASEQLRSGRRFSALGSVAKSMLWGREEDQLKCALEALLGTSLYDQLGKTFWRKTEQ